MEEHRIPQGNGALEEQ